jgi:hypothetical protein
MPLQNGSASRTTQFCSLQEKVVQNFVKWRNSAILEIARKADSAA